MATLPYDLNIDGPLLRRQRGWLLGIAPRSDDEINLREGLLNLLDAIADQAHDKYGIDCLLEENDES
jgi:hypothetical protein